MPNNEVKQRKKATSQKQHDEPAERSNNIFEDETKKAKAKEGYCLTEIKSSSQSSLDLKTITCLLTLVVCVALTWVVLQQNARVFDVEEKYKLLSRKTAGLLGIQEEVIEVSKKLAASEDDLQSALATVSLASRLEREISSLHIVVKVMQDDENSASRELQTINSRFTNVTEAWQVGLSSLTSDMASLRAESREAHASTTDQINEAERRARALDERLEELEDSTRRNTRALGRTEDEDAKQAQNQLDWNTKQLHKLEDQVRSLLRVDTQIITKLEEHIPRAQQCEAHLPAVEEAVRSILRLGGDLGSAERRLEELTLQVFGTEDSMLKALTEILDIRRSLDALQAHNSILKMRNELAIVKETLGQLNRKEERQDNQGNHGMQEGERGGGQQPSE
ncbi:inhibitor of nuclear factor kappa-B kinase-interacting protein [Esox lucius]|uniref:IKBKB interacting protein n=1 Tax=Esox lucius TaxID=8010 RepID=A0AAY5K399_ESOLU|nr:inhibitor of nuclear factor kappa-B kinase-interacting protein [Esox lucius]